MKKLFLIIAILIFSAPPALAAPLDDLRSDLDQWFDSGAAGFLVWQYSGPKDKYFENDPYSFYQGSPVCQILKQAADKFPYKFVGVNIHSLTNHPTQIDDTFSYLSKECGVSVVRVWGSPDRGDPKLVLDSAKKYGVKIIVVLADYSNSSGDILPGQIRSNPTQWYQSDYRSYYLPFVKQTASVLKGHPALFAYELANEPHCSGIDACRGPYKLWANDVAQQIKRVDPDAKVSIGQKSNENTTLGDSPGNGDFKNSNDSLYIDLTSAHYYNSSEKLLSSQAQSQSNQLSKPFYLGEVGYKFDEIPTGSPLPTKKGPLEEGFRPTRYNCSDTADPEYNPLRPYPGSPCDPLIPRSVPEAPLTSEKKFNTFACGTSLTPSTIERFDPYGQNGAYENRLTAGYAHTVCDPVPVDSPTGTTATCWRSSAFDVTVDLSHANLGVLSNTQDTSLTDAQKVNEYLSWYLTGTPQIGDQLPIDSNNPADISRVVNYSGPLRKLMPFDLQNIAKSTIVKSANIDVHNYIVGCKKDVDFTYVLNAIKAWFETLKSSAGLILTVVTTMPRLPFDLYDFITTFSDATAQLIPILQSFTLGDAPKILAILTPLGKTDLANDLAKLGEVRSDYLHDLGNLFNSLNLDMAESCQTSQEFIRLKEQLLVKGYRPYPYPVGDLPPDPSAYTSFGEYWKKYNNWRGLTNVIFFGTTNLPNPLVNESVWAQLFQNVPFSSMEDTAGEYTMSVFRDPANDQQVEGLGDQVYSSVVKKNTAPLQLIIKSANLAQ